MPHTQSSRTPRKVHKESLSPVIAAITTRRAALAVVMALSTRVRRSLRKLWRNFSKRYSTTVSGSIAKKFYRSSFCRRIICSVSTQLTVRSNLSKSTTRRLTIVILIKHPKLQLISQVIMKSKITTSHLPINIIAWVVRNLPKVTNNSTLSSRKARSWHAIKIYLTSVVTSPMMPN